MTPRRPKQLLGDEYTWQSQPPVVDTRGVLTPAGEYIGDSWLPVVDFLVYFEQASKQVYEKSFWSWKIRESRRPNVLITGES